MLMMKTEQKCMPSLRFPPFKGKWIVYNLGDLACGGFNNGVFNDPQKVGSGYPLINVKDMYLGEKIDISKLTLLDIDEKEFKINKIELVLS